MSKSIQQVANHFNGKIVKNEVSFTFGSDDFHFTGDRVYSVVDGQIVGLGVKAKSLLSVENYVAEVAENI